MRPIRVKAKGRRKQPPGVMNKTEKLYLEHLELELRAGNILWYSFEAIKLRLAKNTFYTPDVAVMNKDGEIELHEVKGHWEDDARVKFKVIMEKFWMFRFVLVKRIKGGWLLEGLRGGDPE